MHQERRSHKDKGTQLTVVLAAFEFLSMKLEKKVI